MVRRASNPAPVTPPAPTEPVCKYAGDASDEYCKVCNGITITEGTTTLPASNCGGYCLEDGASATPVAATPEPEPTPPPQAATRTTPPPAASSKRTAPASQKPEEHKETPPQSTDNVAPGMNVPDEHAVTKIKAESGLSFEMKDDVGGSRWYKFAYTEERVLQPGADIEEERQKLWEDVNRVVDDQVEDTLNGCQ